MHACKCNLSKLFRKFSYPNFGEMHYLDKFLKLGCYTTLNLVLEHPLVPNARRLVRSSVSVHVLPNGAMLL
jgi:hypothetical protein